MMNGVDDYPRPHGDHRRSATRSRSIDFARAKGIDELSIWAIQRDNGGCPGDGRERLLRHRAERVGLQGVLKPFTGP